MPLSSVLLAASKVIANPAVGLAGSKVYAATGALLARADQLWTEARRRASEAGLTF